MYNQFAGNDTRAKYLVASRSYILFDVHGSLKNTSKVGFSPILYCIIVLTLCD